MKRVPFPIPPPKNGHRHCNWRSPIPAAALYVVVALLLMGFCVSTFFLVVVHNALFLVLFLCISALIVAFLLWNSSNVAVSFFLHSLPDADLHSAAHGQLLKITGVVSCGNVSLESSYEKVSPCVYTSTVLYEYGEICLNVRDICSLQRLAYCERQSTDFYITDLKSGMRVLVKAGPDCEVIPFVIEPRLIKTSKKCRVLSPDLRKWLTEREISAEARSLWLQEGYIREGCCVSVVGVLQNVNDVMMIVEPNEMVSTGCLWSKLLLPTDFQGLVIGLPKTAVPAEHCPQIHTTGSLE